MNLRGSENSTRPLPTAVRCTTVRGESCFGGRLDGPKGLPLPLGPADVEGLVNLRGRIVTAVSLKRRLAKAPLDCLRGALAIGIEHDGESFALVVDDVGDVIPCQEAAEIAHPPHIDPRRAHLTKTYYRLDSGILPILDMDAVFNWAERNRSCGSAIHMTAATRSDQ